MNSLRLTSLMVAVLCYAVSSSAQDLPFTDNFDRSDGPVSNGWTSWWSTVSPADLDIQIRDGELITKGSYGNAGGVFRPLLVTYPAKVSFDFRTTLTPADSQCSATGRNESAWVMSLNFQASGGPVYPQLSNATQLFFAYNNPLHYVSRIYRASAGHLVEDYGIPVEEKPIPGEVSANPGMHVDGLIRTDGSASIGLYFRDGQSPDPVVYEFPAVPGGLPSAPGINFAVGNGSCNTGEQIFDNLVIETERTGPPRSKEECKGGGWELFLPPYANQGQCIKASRTGR